MQPTKELEKITSRHHLVLMDIVLNGMSNYQAAQKHGLTPEYISQIQNTGLWKKEERKLRDELLSGHKSRLAELIPSAIETLKEVSGRGYHVIYAQDKEGEDLTKFVTNPPSTRQAAATAILDRSGLGLKQGDDHSKNIIINMFKPPWEGGVGETVTIEMES